MADTIELADQRRWNTDYGTAALAELRANPEEWLIENRPANPSIDALLERLPSLAGKRVLDFGSGQGWQSIALARTGALVTGVELGGDLVAVAREIASLNNAACTFRIGSVTDLPFDDESFDCVIGNDILHHLTETQLRESMEQAFRVLKPGGKAYISEPLENSPLFDGIQNLVPVGKRGTGQYRPSILQRKQWAQYLEVVDHRALSDKELLEAGHQFQEISIEYAGWLARLDRLVPFDKFKQFTAWVDPFLSHQRSPIRRLSRSARVVYTK